MGTRPETLIFWFFGGDIFFFIPVVAFVLRKILVLWVWVVKSKGEYSRVLSKSWEVNIDAGYKERQGLQGLILLF